MTHSNKLCLVLLATSKEYRSGEVHKCLDSYFSSEASQGHSIDVKIFFNNGDLSNYSDLLKYEKNKNINKVIIKSLKLEGMDDLYCRTPQELKNLQNIKIPLLGGSAGPNNLFFNSMIPLMGEPYRDYLMIECDTLPIKNYWADKVIEYCDNSSFMIAGSMYRGKHQLPSFDSWTGHLNGVAIYRRSENLKSFLSLSRKTIINKVASNKNYFVSFDVGMHNFLGTLNGRKYFNNPDLPDNMLIDSPIISNFSLPIDTATSIKSVKEQHPHTIILHQKT
jgi:hypothetical protein